MTKSQAEDTCRDFKKLADRLQAEVQVKLEDLCSNHIKKNAEDLLEQYKKKIAELSQDMNIGNVEINPFEIMEGSIGNVENIEDILREAEKSETVKEKVGEHKEYKEVLGLRRWLNEKIGTSFNVDFDWVDDYDWVEKQYIDGTMLAQKFFAPIQKSLFETQGSAIEYAKNQTKKIKSEFTRKFDQLDKVLKDKLKELEQCARDNENIELRIKESEDKLAWLEDIQDRVKQILDI